MQPKQRAHEMTHESDKTIADYLAAYAALYPITDAPRIVYERGWFRFRGLHGRRYRRAQLDAMTALLRKRASSSSTNAGINT